jgi:hypothetical protein
VKLRLCEPDCCYPNDQHIEPEPDWIGNDPVMHGESERPVPGTTEAYCLCGHPNYMTCMGWLNGGGIGGWTFERAEP